MAESDDLRRENESLRRRLRAAERLQEQPADQIISAMTDGILVFDTERWVVRANDAAISVLGFNPVGLHASDLDRRVTLSWPNGTAVLPDEQPSARALRGETVTGLRLVVAGAAGRFAFSASCSPLRVGGRITGAISVWHDLTAYESALEALRESEGKYRSLFEHSLDGILLTMADGRITDANAAACRMFDMSRDEVCAAGGEALVENTPALTAALEERRRVGRALAELTFIRKGGERFRVEVFSMVVGPMAGGERAFVIFRDITQRRQMQDALREREERYRILFDASPSSIVVVGLDGTIHAFNEEAHTQLGYTREEFARLRVADIDANETPDDVHQHIERIVRAGGATFESRHLTKAGEVRNMSVNARVIEVDGKKLLLTVCRDVTEGKHVEEALLEADHNKSQFLAMLSHELRNPLAPIRNSLYILDRADPRGEQALHARSVIARQVSHMARLIDDLLDVTRIARGKIQLQCEPLDLLDVASRTLDDFRTSFQGVGITVELVGGVDSLPVLGDRTRLAQALGNLLHNASKFTPRGGHVVVSAEADATREEAVLRVRDDGAGISADVLPRLFQPFAQAENTLDRTRGGLGLGLSLVKALIELHGGTVAARSDGPHRGAEFSIRVPLRSEAAPVVRAARSAARRSRRVLIIEDNIDAADSLREALKLLDHEVAVAYAGPEGLDRARVFRPEVVFCDIGLPGMDGFDVARAFRADDRLKTVFLVALSGYAMPEDKRRASDAGFQRHLSKPASLDTLGEVLAQLPEPLPSAPTRH